MKLFAMLGLMLLTSTAANAQPIAVDLQGKALLDHFETHFSPTRALSYTEARHEMFSDQVEFGIPQNEIDSVLCIY